ncbi:MAG: iron-sulfur cluster repair di-iron protein [Blastocatellia bacterium]|nr:iron-sulfur cluster repair di-iron protein [Blastocatellia bacterium]
MTINTTKTVRDLALEMPRAATVFEDLRIDYCCGGGRSLSEACAAAGVSVQDVMRSLEQAEQTREEIEDWQSKRLSELTSYIIDNHHVFTREELRRSSDMILKVCSAHARNHPELLRIQSMFIGLAGELTAHMLKEENVLFPYITALEEATLSGDPRPIPFFGTVRNPVRMMMMEHDTAAEVLRAIRAASLDFAVPPDACASYRALYQTLETLERDLHRHIHLENNILFPRAVEMETAIATLQPSR